MKYGGICKRMDKKNNDIARRREELRERYRIMHENGANLYVSATPDEVASLCVKEDLPYMPDYIYDANGSLIQIIFDRVDQM